MPNRDWLIDSLHRRNLTNTDKILSVLLDGGAPEQSARDIRETLKSHGVKEAENWNISSILASLKRQGKIKCIDDKWSLLPWGRDYLIQKGLQPPQDQAVLVKARNDIRSRLSKISNPHTLAFLEEAIRCLEAGLLRSAVVMSWVGAVSILHEHVVNNRLTDFNNAAQKRDAKWKLASNADGLARMQEIDFLQILEDIGIIGKNVKQELQNNCLHRRNACGHPNSYQIGEQVVAAHIEFLILNVYSQF